MGLFEDVGNGIYDFASDTLDNIGNIVSELNGMARDNIPIVRDVEDSIHGAYDWGWINYDLMKLTVKSKKTWKEHLSVLYMFLLKIEQ